MPQFPTFEMLDTEPTPALPDCRTCYYIRGTIDEEWCSLLREDCRDGSKYVARWGIDPVRLYERGEE